MLVSPDTGQESAAPKVAAYLPVGLRGGQPVVSHT